MTPGRTAGRFAAGLSAARVACAIAALPACNSLFGRDVHLADGGFAGGVQCSMQAAPCAASSVPVAGDWDGDGRDAPGLFDNGRWCITNTRAPSDVCALQWGAAGDTPVVGDWNGDGCDSPGWYRDAFWSLESAGAGGEAAEFGWGTSGELPVAGDWDGRRYDTPGRARDFSEHLAWALSNHNSSGGIDHEFTWGVEHATPLVGDWDGNGTDTPASYVDGLWTFSNVNAGGGLDAATFRWGSPGDIPIAGDWNGDGFDTVGLYRDGTWMLADDRIETIAGSGGPLVVTTFRWGVP
jgi:hypothetical protein